MVSEQPDVIAWKNWGHCIVIECKVSRSDFLRDHKKWFRRNPEQGMGHERWLAAPTGLVAAEEIPERWGLLAVRTSSKRVSVVRKAEPFTDRNDRHETSLLISALRRATEGWGRRIFGDAAPAMVDGDPHPSAAKTIRELRDENRRLREQLATPDRSNGDGA